MNANAIGSPPNGASGSSRSKYSSLVSRNSATSVAQLGLQLEVRVDPDRRAAREREAVAVPDADLQVGGRREPLVQAGEEVEVVQARGD